MLSLNTIPGVIGGMLTDERGTILAQSFPSTFDQGMLKRTADLLLDNTAGMQDATGGAKLFDMRFELGRIIIKTLPRMFLVMLCNSSVNVQLLLISINVASTNLEKIAHSVPERTIEAPVVQASTGGLKPSPSELIENSPIAASLSGIQADLAKFLGPMAKIVFVECVEKWLESHQPSMETLPELIKIINPEINDREKIIQFTQMVDKYMR